MDWGSSRACRTGGRYRQPGPEQRHEVSYESCLWGWEHGTVCVGASGTLGALLCGTPHAAQTLPRRMLLTHQRRDSGCMHPQCAGSRWQRSPCNQRQSYCMDDSVCVVVCLQEPHLGQVQQLDIPELRPSCNPALPGTGSAFSCSWVPHHPTLQLHATPSKQRAWLRTDEQRVWAVAQRV